MKYLIACRSSELSIIQANLTKDTLIKAYPDISVSIKAIKSEGDLSLNTPLREIGGKMLFTRKIDSVVLASDKCIGVHSLKDVDSKIPEGLYLGGFLSRICARDVIVSIKKYKSVNDIKSKSRVGTVSLRRKAQLLRNNPDLEITQIRGNIIKRLSLLDNDKIDALILAEAGIKRLQNNGLNLDKYCFLKLPIEDYTPAPGQGIIALTCKEKDLDTRSILDKITNKISSIEANYERAFVTTAEMDCFAPIAVYAWLKDSQWFFVAKLYEQDGTIIRQVKIELKANYSDAIKQIQQNALVFKDIYKSKEVPRISLVKDK